MVYGYTQRNSDLCGYSVKNGLDGLHEWHVYAKTEAEGVDLIVNGTPVIAKGEHTGSRAGRVLRHLPK